MIVLDAENLVKVYKDRDKSNCTKALNGIELKVEDGEFVAIMGSSGSGKTTLLNVLSGIDRAYEGKIRISGTSIHEMSGDELALFRRRRLGFVFQEFNLLDSLTLRENIMLPMTLDNRNVVEMSEKTDKVMSMLDIYDIMDKYPYTVSGGQQQRTAICRAVINDPDIVFADEPTGNLDSKSSKAVMKCFERLNTLNHSTILTVTHDAFAASYCSRVIFIKDGLVHMEITKKGDRKEFFDHILESLAMIGGEKDDL
jgi:putative ABC transport system ATP-binding protein